MAHTNAKFTSTSGLTAGPCRLSPGRALSLQSAHGGLLRVTRGGLWATFDGPHAGPGNRLGDHVLEAGDLLVLGPGERLVVEPARAAQEAQIEWRPADAPCEEARLVRLGAPA